MNPYPLESELLKIFEHFKNVCIVMKVDTCRDLNEFQDYLWDVIDQKKNDLREEQKTFRSQSKDRNYK